MNDPNYIETRFEDIGYLLSECKILVVTATDIETKFTHGCLTPLENYQGIVKVFKGNYTYYFGALGKYGVIHVQCAMGSIARSGSIMTVSTALEQFQCKVVVMVGIAFGKNKESQRIGDVFVSESVIPYNSKRVGNDHEILRGIEARASQILLDRFKNIKDWCFNLDEDRNAEIVFTRMLSGEHLVDNIEHRDSLFRTYPDSKGGEMEGAGVSTACGDHIDWILVKGLCDFADGNKSENKESNQEIAVMSALSLCLRLFESDSAFADLDIHPIGLKKKLLVFGKEKVSKVLFDVYDVSKNLYYIDRVHDNTFCNALSHYGIWVYGPSGCGKTNLIIRNLVLLQKEIVQINLATCIGQPVESFFYEILYELSYKCNDDSHPHPTDFKDCCRQLIRILKKNYLNRECVIFIEEIPISTKEGFQEFAEKLFSLVISKEFVHGLSELKFVLSSIGDPTLDIHDFHQKIHQHIFFMKLDFWSSDEMDRLIQMIVNELQVVLSKDTLKELEDRASGSPRFVKKFFRSVFSLQVTDEKMFRMLLIDTERDLRIR